MIHMNCKTVNGAIGFMPNPIDCHPILYGVHKLPGSDSYGDTYRRIFKEGHGTKSEST